MKTLRIIFLFAFLCSARAADLRFEVEPADQFALPGETVLFESQAISASPVSYQWYKGNFALPAENGASLSFQVVDAQDAGIYRVRASAGSENLFSRDAVLTVLTQPTISITAPTPNYQFGSEEQHRFTVSITSPTSPATRVEYFNGNALLATTTEAPFDATVSLPLGQYNLRAVVTTVHNTTATSAIVPFAVVQSAPIITLQPLDQRVFAGRVVDLRGAATGEGAVTYRWTRNNQTIEGATSPTLSVTVAGPAQEGEYRLVASNGSGAATSRAAVVSIATVGPNFTGRFKHSIITAPVDQYASMASGNGILMVVGPSGFVVTSTDGIDWRETSPPYTDNFLRVRFLNGKFWLLTDRGAIVTTEDAQTWERIDAITGGAALRDITYFNGAYIAVGAFGRIARSIDGAAWTLRFMGEQTFIAIATGPTAVVAATSRQQPEVWRSANGTDWTTPSVSAASSESLDIHHFSGRFVILRYDGVYTSADGIAWTMATTGRYHLGIPSPSRLTLYNYDRRLARTENGVDFVQDPALTSEIVTAGVYSGIYYLTGPGSYLAGSVNGLNMSVLAPSYRIPAVVPRVNFGNGKFYITGGGIDVRVSDGAQGWFTHIGITVPEQGTSLSGVAYGAGGFVATAFNRLTAWLSDDGLYFAPSPTPAPTISLLKNQEGEYLGVNGANVYRSTDGRGWTSRFLGTGVVIANIAKGDGKVVAVGRDGKVFLSENGAAFEAITPITANYLQGATHANGLFVVVGKNGFVMHSPDGRRWFEGKRDVVVEAIDVAFAEGMFVATMNGGGVLYSWDGVNWEREQLHSAQDLFSINYGNRRWVIGGRNGLLMQTAPAGFAQPQIVATLDGGELVLTIVGDAGDVLRLESAETVEAAEWPHLETITLTPSPAVRRFPAAGQARFIRLLRAQ